MCEPLRHNNVDLIRLKDMLVRMDDITSQYFLLVICAIFFCQNFMKCGTFCAHCTICAKNQWGEYPMFDFNDPLIVTSFLFGLGIEFGQLRGLYWTWRLHAQLECQKMHIGLVYRILSPSHLVGHCPLC